MSIDIDTLFKNFPSEKEMTDIIMPTSAIVWEGELSLKSIEKWLQNFSGEILEKQYERRLALWLLTHFTYYNKKEVNHLCKTVYRHLIHFIIKDIDPISETSDLILETTNQFFSKTNIISAEATSGSGGFIAYIFRQVNSLPIRGLFNFSIENISDDIENIIVVDDVTLSVGEDGQLYKFWESSVKRFPNKNFYLLTLLANKSSIDYLTNKFNINVITSIILDDRHKCFSEDSDVFSDFPELRVLAKQVMEHYGNKIGITESLGYKNGQQTFGFYYNIPDNTLPIFWGQRNGWAPILKRHHKNYHNKKYINDERFI